MGRRAGRPAAAPIRDDGGRWLRDRSKAKKTRKKEEEEEYTKEELEQMLGKGGGRRLLG